MAADEPFPRPNPNQIRIRSRDSHRSNRRHILTIEDPIEYELQGVVQAQVDTAVGLTFATALRAFLRFDPNVIMVGEMRDRETIELGITAAETGREAMLRAALSSSSSKAPI